MTRNVEEYMEYLKTTDKSYQWPIESFEKRLPERKKLHQNFPYVVTYPGIYDWLDHMEDWCREKFGNRHGKCSWDDCEFSFDKWYEDNNFDELLHQEQLKNCGVRPDREKNKKEWDIWHDKSSDVIHKHFEMIKKRLDSPHEHSHKGIWTTIFLVKTGYDYGYQDFCFKNEEDAIYFKLMWDEENVKR